MNVGDEIVERLKRIMNEMNWSQTEVSKQVGASQGVVSKWILGKHRPNLESAARINELFSELFPDANDPLAVKKNDISELLPTLDMKVPIITKNAAIPDANGGTWSVPHHIAARMPRSARGMTMVGDSMEPTIPKGSTVFVDTAHRVLDAPDLYAIESGGGVTIKRLGVLPGGKGVQVMSDNRVVYGEPVTAEMRDVNVIGRMVAVFSWKS